MRIALFSDIHANLPALEACFDSIAAHQPDALYCLGDLVGYNIWPNEVIDAIRQRGIPTIAGNYDEGIGANTGDCGCAYKTGEEKAMGNISISFTNSIIRDDARAWLHGLPAHMRVEFRRQDQWLRLLLVHGSPRRVNEYLFEDREEKSLLRMMDQAGADILCFGHTHKPYHKKMKDDSGRYRHAINTGSVGKPKDGDPRGCWVLLNISQQDAAEPAVTVAFIRFSYDVEKAARAVEDSLLPDAYAAMLRKGI